LNSNLESYLCRVETATANALELGRTSIADSLPCTILRELEVPANDFTESSDPFMLSFRALRRIQRLVRPVIPRKIEFGSAVYLKEGVIDCLFPNSPVTVVFIGDGESDKRFAYNCRRLFSAYSYPYKTYCFVMNPALIGVNFGEKATAPGWDEEQLFYHAISWSELSILAEVISPRPGSGVILVVDLDGTLLCPRPKYSERVKDVRRTAIVALCDDLFDDALFSAASEDQVMRLQNSYTAASRTGFSKAYDDEDLTMLIALGLYADLIREDDPLLNPEGGIGFVLPVEWLQYAAFLIENDPLREHPLRQLRSLFIRCTDAIQSGSPTAFLEFRKKEEEMLVVGAAAGDIGLNRVLIEFIRDAASRQAVPIGFSDRPNASLGLVTPPSPIYTTKAAPGALFTTPLPLLL
jgi:hypothetical protein